MSGKTNVLLISIVLTIFIASIGPVFALQEDFDVFSQNTALNVCSCSFAKNTLSIRNSGDVTSVYTLGQSDSTASWSTLNQKRFTLKAGETKDVLDYIRAPCDSEGVYTLKTTINTIFGLQKEIEQPLEVRTCRNIDIQTSALSKSTCPCSPIAYEFTIANSGDHEETYSLGVEPYDEHVTLSTAHITIAAGQSKQVAVFINKPCSVYGGFNYVFRAVGEGSNVVGELPFGLVVNQCYDYTIDSPAEAVACNNFENIIPIRIRNIANIANTYQLSATLDSGEEFSFDPVFLSGRQTQNVNLSVLLENLDAGQYVLGIDALTARGGVNEHKDITLNVEECDESGNPVTIEEEETDLTPYFIALGALVVIILLILGIYLAGRSRRTDGEITRKSADAMDPRRRLLRWLILIVLLLVFAGIVLGALLLPGVFQSEGTNESVVEENVSENMENGSVSENIENTTRNITDVPSEEAIPIEGEEATGEEETVPALWIYGAIAAVIIILSCILLAVALVRRKRQAMPASAKKEERSYLKPAGKKNRWWLWGILILIILVGLAAGGYGTYRYLSQPTNTITSVDTTGLETSFGAVVAKQGETIDIPLLATNAGETTATIDFTVDRAWLESDTKELSLAPGDEAQVFLTIHPDDTIPQTRYSIEFPGQDDVGNAFTDKVVIKVEDAQGSFLSRYLWFIVAAAVIIVLLVVGDIIRRVRRSRRTMKETEAREFIAGMPEKAAMPAVKSGAPKEPPSTRKVVLILSLITLVLAGLIGGTYFMLTALSGNAPASQGLLEEQGLVQEGEVVEEAPPVEVSGEEGGENILEISNRKTIIPVNIRNINEGVTYHIAVQEDIEWISVTDEAITVPPGQERTAYIVVDPRQGAKDGKYAVAIDVNVEGQEEPLFSSTITLDVKKYRWLDTFLSYLFYIVLGLAVLFVIVLLVRRQDIKAGKIRPKEKVLPQLKAAESSLLKEAEKEGKAKKGKTQIRLK